MLNYQRVDPLLFDSNNYSRIRNASGSMEPHISVLLIQRMNHPEIFRGTQCDTYPTVGSRQIIFPIGHGSPCDPRSAVFVRQTEKSSCPNHPVPLKKKPSNQPNKSKWITGHTKSLPKHAVPFLKSTSRIHRFPYDLMALTWRSHTPGLNYTVIMANLRDAASQLQFLDG